jgi:hypothetical protein
MQKQLKDQLEDLGEQGRAQRYFREARGGKADEQQNGARGEPGPGQGAPQSGRPGQPGQGQPGPAQAPEPADERRDRPQLPAPEGRGRARGPAPAEAPGGGEGGFAYAATGTFSLPVELPEGEVHLDFARPGGQAELAVWAVRERSIQTAWRTAAIAVGALLLWLAVRLLARVRLPRGWKMPALVAAYVVLAAILVALGGLVGLAVWLALVLIAEIARRLLRRVARRVS